MATVADVNLSTWNRYPSSPRLRGSDPFGSNLISVGQAIESDLAQSIAGGDVVAAYAPSADSRLIYVSATGNDGTGASTTIAAQTDAFDPQGTVLPYLTITAGVAQLRDGYPDWLILKRGDTWTGETISVTNKSGRSNTERMVFTCYGTTGARPIIKTGTVQGIIASQTTGNHTLYGLDFYAHTRDPSSVDYVASSAGKAGVQYITDSDNITVDDCIMRFYLNGMNVQGSNVTINNLVIKRCIITDSYAYRGSSHSQGIFVDDVNGILIEDTLFDMNGWNPDIVDGQKTLFNHAMYLQSTPDGANVIVKNNIIARSSSNGLQSRSGGLVQDNLAVENSIGILIADGAVGTYGNAVDNVILNGVTMNNTGSNVSITAAIWGLDVVTGGSADITNNIVANRTDTSASESGITIVGDATYTSNVVYAWNSSEDMTDGAWTHPTHDVGDYMNSIGETATLDAYLTALRTRELGVWLTKYAAPTVNNYIRAGFDR